MESAAQRVPAQPGYGRIVGSIPKLQDFYAFIAALVFQMHFSVVDFPLL